MQMSEEDAAQVHGRVARATEVRRGAPPGVEQQEVVARSDQDGIRPAAALQRDRQPG
jgi:hypothetical protein